MSNLMPKHPYKFFYKGGFGIGGVTGVQNHNEVSVQHFSH